MKEIEIEPQEAAVRSRVVRFQNAVAERAINRAQKATAAFDARGALVWLRLAAKASEAAAKAAGVHLAPRPTRRDEWSSDAVDDLVAKTEEMLRKDDVEKKKKKKK